MKKKDGSQFPWYMIYTPAVTILLIMWVLDTSSGDGSVDVLEKILQFLEVNERTVVCILVIAASLFALVFVITKWISTNKHLESIDAVASSAPEELDKKITETGTMVYEKVAQKIDGQDRSFIKDISDIKACAAEIRGGTATVQQQLMNFSKPQEGVSIQQGELISIIHEIYERHDRDQQEIINLRARVSQLEEQNKELLEKNQELEKSLRYRGQQQEAHGRNKADREPER